MYNKNNEYLVLIQIVKNFQYKTFFLLYNLNVLIIIFEVLKAVIGYFILIHLTKFLNY